MIFRDVFSSFLCLIIFAGKWSDVDALPVSNRHVGPFIAAVDADWFAGDAPSPDRPQTDEGNSTNNSTTSSEKSNAETFSPDSAVKWLQKFGYLGSTSSGFGTAANGSESLYEADAVLEAIIDLQNFAGLPETGVVDDDTIKVMQSPRCGNADRTRKSGRRSKRYALGSDGWNKRHLSVFLGNWNVRLGQEATMEKLRRAFEVWQPYANLTFSFVGSPDADIVVAFGRGYHGDNYPFDGVGNVLAHAYYPHEGGHYAGDIHFDDDELWRMPNSEMTTQSSDGVQIWYGNQGTDLEFFDVAVHEIGHSLGLAHSHQRDSVMYPFYKSDGDSTRLGYSDILGLYHLYIARRLPGDLDQHTSEPPGTATTASSKFDEKATTESFTIINGADSTVKKDEKEVPSTTRTFDEITSSIIITKEPRTPFGEVTATTPTFSSEKARQATSTDANNDASEQTTSSSTRNGLDSFPGVTLTTSSPVSTTTTPDVARTSASSEQGHPVYEGDFETVEEHLKHMADRDGHDVHHEGHFDEDRQPNSKEDIIPDICEGKLDSIANLRGEIFAFKGEYLWRFRGPNELVDQYPVKFREMFQDLPPSVRKIDASYEDPSTGDIMLFSKSNWWIFDGMNTRGPYSLEHLGLPEAAERIDAAFAWSKNSAVYLFRDDRYWKLDERTRTPAEGYPQPVSRWRGLPGQLDDAFVWQGRTYFIKGKKYWRFDDDKVEAEQEYPQIFADSWLGCGAENFVQKKPVLP